MLKQYLKGIFDTGKRGDAREESYYETLAVLLREAATSSGKSKFHITTLPKHTEAGNPDFRIWDGKQQIVGYIEAKAPTVENLDTVKHSDQLKRYRHTFRNLILTNFFEFRLYRNGERILKTRIARPFILNTLKTIPPLEKDWPLNWQSAPTFCGTKSSVKSYSTGNPNIILSMAFMRHSKNTLSGGGQKGLRGPALTNHYVWSVRGPHEI